jgi:clan AA aspartic protease
LTVRSASGTDHDIEAVVDTGFSGELTLPTSVIAALGFRWRTRNSRVLADGTNQYVDIYVGIIVWDGMVRHVFIEAADTHPLVGMTLISGNRLQIEGIPGGRVTIEKLPATGP